MQAAFKHNVNKIIDGWCDTTARALERLFDGTDQSTNPGSSVNYLTYPCGVPPDPNSCGTSSFDDMTSDVSPLASDCLQIIRNFEGNGGTMWQTQILGKKQREIASHGCCRFGVEATEQKGNVHIHVGGQDVADIINDAVRRFRRSNGRVGAKGEMRCYGNLRDQGVLWGIY